MCRWWNVLIGFGAGNGGASTSHAVNLLTTRPQVSGQSVLELVPVGYCPFCGRALSRQLWNQEKKK